MSDKRQDAMDLNPLAVEAITEAILIYGIIQKCLLKVKSGQRLFC